MKKLLLFVLIAFFCSQNNQAQTISIIGDTSPSGDWGIDTDLTTTDNITYTLNNVTLTTATGLSTGLKFRQDHDWTNNWGGTTFPSGTGQLGGQNIQTVAGVYNITFNRVNGTYTFISVTYPIVSMIGNTSPTGDWVTDLDMTTTDGVHYTYSNLTLTAPANIATDGLKFRQDHDWTNNWGGTTFPSGTGIASGQNLPTVAGYYNVAFNLTTKEYSFTDAIPNIGIWGPAVNSQLGYGAPDVKMTTTDGITYTLSGFIFSTGNAYFRQNDNGTMVWGSTSFPTGTATYGGPSLSITGGEWFVTFNRITGEYSFAYPSIGILGTATPDGWSSDIDLTTTDGFTYTISNLVLTDGEVKFRKDNLWTSNWGSAAFPIGTGTQDGANIPVTAGTYNVTFDKSTGNYNFNALSSAHFNLNKLKVYPNPSNSNWNFNSDEMIESIQIMDVLGKNIAVIYPKSETATIDITNLNSGMYFAKIATSS